MGNQKKEVQILQNKVHKTLEMAKKRSKSVLTTIEKEGSLLQDFVAPLGGANKLSFYSNGKLSMNLKYQNEKGKNTKKSYGLHPHALAQCGEKLGIPTRYIKDLGTSTDKWQRDLAEEILNNHTVHSTRNKVLVRTVGDQVRGVLSDSYRRLNSGDIYAQYISAVGKAGGQVIDAYASETKTYIESVLPEVISVPTANNGTVHMVFGTRISNSDFGDGALEVRAFNMQVVCMNGMTRKSLMRQIHLGRRIPDEMLVQDDTWKADTMAQGLLVRDLVLNNMNKNSILEHAQKIQNASRKTVDFENQIKLLPRKGILKNECASITKALLDNRADQGLQGEPSLWKLTQAITAVANQGDDLRRKRELGEVAGALLDTV